MHPPEPEQIRRLLFDALAVDALGKLVSAAAAAGVPIAPVKGIVLSRVLYEQLYQRPSRDLDVIAARADLPRLRDEVERRGWPIRHYFPGTSELEFSLGRVTVEVHGEMGRRDLSRVTTAEMLARASLDTNIFSFPVLRIDDIDHLLLVVANVIKKGFAYANPHQPDDLERLLVRLQPRWEELGGRLREARFATGFSNVADWMIEVHHSAAFAAFVAEHPLRPRPIFAFLVRTYRRRARRLPNRLQTTSGLLGLVLATLTPDDRRLRLRGASRLIQRGIYRRFGRDPG
jgi:hypothetical protein